VGTYLERSIDHNRVALLPHISLYDPATVQRLQQYTQNFMSRGFPAAQAQQQAYAALEGVLMKQVSLLSYSQVFTSLGMFFLICLPLILLIKRVKVVGKVSLDAH